MRFRMRTTGRRLWLAGALLALLAGAATLWAALGPRRTATLAYVAVAGDNCVRVIDLATGETLRRIYSGATPWRLVVSPDRGRLWVQHWYAETTAVVDLAGHEVVGVLPFRGPGAFSADGAQFLTYSWPGSALEVIDAGSLKRVRETVTEVARVYDLAPDPDGQTLHLVQYDPVTRGPRERFSYLLSYPWREQDPARAHPLSQRTGKSPAAVEVLRTGPFLLTADRETNGLTLLNELGDGRSISTCAAPQAIVLSADERRMAVLCWRGEGERRSQLVLYRTDFTARPWPAVTETGTATVDGGLVAGAFSPDGKRLYVVDRPGGKLLEADAETLERKREIPVGDLPVDIAIVPVPGRARDLLVREKSRARRQVEEALARLRGPGRPFADLGWIETASERPGKEAGSPAPQPRRRKVALRPPDRLRVEEDDGGLRLSAGGDSVAIEPGGRYWVAPRQELVSLVLSLPALSTEDAVRLLAGDVPGSPWLRGGIAMDIATEVAEPGGGRSLLVGASQPGERVSQLWIDLTTGRPTSIVEQFPVFSARGHRDPSFGGILETKLYDFRQLAPGLAMPTRFERVLDGRLTQDVRLEGFAADRKLPESLFDLARLGGARAAPGLFPPAPAAAMGVPAVSGGDLPDRAVPVASPPYLESPGEPHPAYASSPPTSGPRLPWIADWGIHRVPVPLELQAHNLEHGGVALQYNCPEPCPDLVERLEELARSRDHVLVAPYPYMEPGISLTAWGRIDHLASFDEAHILAFLDAYAGKDHHQAGGPEERVEMAQGH